MRQHALAGTNGAAPAGTRTHARLDGDHDGDAEIKRDLSRDLELGAQSTLATLKV